jgi:hypothetical protein
MHKDFDFNALLSEESGRPVLFNAIAVNDKLPYIYRAQLRWLAEANKQGKPVFGQVATARAANYITFEDWNLYDSNPNWREATTGTVEEKKVKLADPRIRAALREDYDSGATKALVPQVVDAVKTPVLAAGGLADGCGLIAALALGASGVWIGTRFVASVEALAHGNYKHKIVEIDEEGTVITRCHSDKPCRLIRNQFTDSWQGREHEILPFPLQSIKVGTEATKRARYEGKVEEGGLPAGQISGLISAVEPAGEIVRRIMAEARAVLEEGLGRR